MKRSLSPTSSIRTLACLIALTVNPVTLAQENANADVKAFGKLVLPDPLPVDAQAEALDFQRLEGRLALRSLPGHEEQMDKILGKPDNYDEMTEEQQKEWFKQAARSPEIAKHYGEIMRMQQEVAAIPPVPLALEKDGSFLANGLRPGSWSLEARIPHRTENQLSHADISHVFEVKANQEQIDLGQLTLKTYHVLIPGDPAPDFTALTYDGKPFKLSDYRGKYVLIDFWATWCVPCVASIPDLVKVHEEFAGDRFEIIGLSVDKTIEEAEKFHQKKPSPYVHGYVGEKSQSKAAAQYGVRLIPSIWLIGPDGSIVARDLRGEEIHKAVAKALKETGK